MSMLKRIWALLLCACLQGNALAGAAYEQVFYNGKIFTGEPDHPYADAVAIRGDKIVAVGPPNLLAFIDLPPSPT